MLANPMHPILYLLDQGLRTTLSDTTMIVSFEPSPQGSHFSCSQNHNDSFSQQRQQRSFEPSIATQPYVVSRTRVRQRNHIRPSFVPSTYSFCH